MADFADDACFHCAGHGVTSRWWPWGWTQETCDVCNGSGTCSARRRKQAELGVEMDPLPEKSLQGRSSAG